MDSKTSTIRRLDRWDGLILATSTFAAILTSIMPDPESPWSVPPSGAIAPPLPGVAVTTPPTINETTPTAVAVPSVVPASVGPAGPVYDIVAPFTPDPGILARGTEISTPFLTAWTVAFLIIRLRRPRPFWRRLTRQPGLAASGIGSAILIVTLVAHLVRWAAIWLWEAISPTLPSAAAFAWPVERTPLQDLWYSIHTGFGTGSVMISEAVAATWLIMALGGWWRPEKSAIDRLGRALGAAGIALMVVGFVTGFLG